MKGLHHTLTLLATGLVVWLLSGCEPASKDLETIKVGILHSQSGPMAASEKPVIDATIMAIEEINAQGIIPGVKVEYVIADGRSDPAVFAREAERLIKEDKVVAIFGCWTSASRKAVKPVVEKYDSLLFYPVQYEGIESSPNIVYLGAAPNQQIIPAIHWAMEKLGDSMYLVGSDYVFPHTANTIIKDQLHAFGHDAVGEAYLPLNPSDLGPDEIDQLVADIIEKQPDVIVNTLNGEVNTLFFQKLRAAGISPEDIPTLSFSVGEIELRKTGAREMAGDYAAWNYFQSIDTPENARFLKNLKTRYGDSAIASDPMEAAYIGVYLWARAVADAAESEIKTHQHSYDPECVLEYLGVQSFQAPGGMVFVQPQNQHLFKTVRIGQIRTDGDFDIVWESDIPVRPEPYPVFRSMDEWDEYLAKLNRDWGGRWTAPRKPAP